MLVVSLQSALDLLFLEERQLNLLAVVVVVAVVVRTPVDQRSYVASHLPIQQREHDYLMASFLQKNLLPPF